MPRTYWYCWWAGVGAVGVAEITLRYVGMGVLPASLVVVGALLVWIGLIALGVYASKMTIVRRFSFYWSLALLLPALFLLYWTSAVQASTGAPWVNVNYSELLAAIPEGESTTPAVQAFLSQYLSLVAFLFLFVVGGWIVVSLWVGRVAQDKGRSKIAWFWLAMVLPLISWVIVASMARVRPAIPMSDQDTGPIPVVRATKKCPMCAEEVLFEARKCKHCGEFLEDVPTPATP